MSNALIPLILDIAVLVFLAMTIVYVARLFKSLNEFKAQRKEFDVVMTNLMSGVDQAERSITALKQASEQEAGDLEALIRKSQAMSDELKIINEAGESMAKRLEKLAETNRELVQTAQIPKSQRTTKSGGDKISSPVPHRKKDYSETLKNVERANVVEEAADIPKFMIQDRDHGNELSDDEAESVESQAERELLEALKSNKRQGGA